MRYLLDTSAFSDLMREDSRAQGWLSKLRAEDRIGICAIVRGEILYGIQRQPVGRRRSALETKANELLAAFVCAPIGPEASDHYARVKLERQQGGMPLDENDLWIAATALASDARLVTRDHDFEHISGLITENWSA